jgi:hypothetical protein
VGISVELIFAESNSLEQVLDPLLARGPVSDRVVDEGFGDDRPCGKPGVERGVGVLEDHLDVSPDRPQPLSAEVRDIAAMEKDIPPRRIEEAEDKPRQR